eukprot:scaffold14295_cov161-Skeletonema_marinoi.AAC.7
MQWPQPSIQTSTTTPSLTLSGLVPFKSTGEELGTTVRKFTSSQRDRLFSTGQISFRLVMIGRVSLMPCVLSPKLTIQ